MMEMIAYGFAIFCCLGVPVYHFVHGTIEYFAGLFQDFEKEA